MSNEVDPTQPTEDVAAAPAGEEEARELTEDELDQIAGGTIQFRTGNSLTP